MSLRRKDTSVARQPAWVGVRPSDGRSGNYGAYRLKAEEKAFVDKVIGKISEIQAEGVSGQISIEPSVYYLLVDPVNKRAKLFHKERPLIPIDGCVLTEPEAIRGLATALAELLQRQRATFEDLNVVRVSEEESSTPSSR